MGGSFLSFFNSSSVSLNKSTIFSPIFLYMNFNIHFHYVKFKQFFIFSNYLL